MAAIRKNENKRPVNNSIDDIDLGFITIMEDSLRVILITHVNKMSKNKDIVGAIALVVALVICLITSNFKNFILSSEAWFGVFLVFTILSVIYLCYVVSNRKKSKDEVEEIIIDVQKAKAGALTNLRVSSPLAQSKDGPNASEQKQPSAFSNTQKKKSRGRKRR